MANGNDVPLGGIGAAIDDEQPSRAKEFFTDPKNLATMLVLGAALAQPRRGGRSQLAHGLRSGVGALAFRGGLDQGITQQQQEAAEAESVIENREATQGIGEERNRLLEDQNLITRQAQGFDVQQEELNRIHELAKIRQAANLQTQQMDDQLYGKVIQGTIDGWLTQQSDPLTRGQTTLEDAIGNAIYGMYLADPSKLPADRIALIESQIQGDTETGEVSTTTAGEPTATTTPKAPAARSKGLVGGAADLLLGGSPRQDKPSVIRERKIARVVTSDTELTDEQADALLADARGKAGNPEVLSGLTTAELRKLQSLERILNSAERRNVLEELATRRD